MEKLTVNASKSYTITITDSLNDFEVIKPLISGKVAIITDSNVNALYGDVLYKLLSEYEVKKYVIPAGEKSKNAKQFIKLVNKLASDGFTRNDAVIAFGGGVVGDLAAFVASTYMRGVTLISVPTTLLSMVDSSVGGKTGIDLKAGKNLCGTFYQPSAVYIDYGFLKTLPEREVKCGYGEIFKYGYLGLDISALKDNNVEKIIFDCLKIKAEIVEKDEKESGLRKLLNLGHTFGHAIEKANNYKFSHGECVAKGLLFALKISENYFGIKNLVGEYTELAERFKIDIDCFTSLDKLFNIMQSDKKRSGDKIDFILINGEKRAEIVPLTTDQIKGYLNER